MATHEEARALLRIAAVNGVKVDGTSMPLVPIPYNPREYSPKNYSGGDVQFVRNITAGLSQIQGFRFPPNSIIVMQEMARFVHATNKKSIVSAPQIHRFVTHFFPFLFEEMLSQRGLYAWVANHATKRAFFFRIHQVHYSVLIQKHCRKLIIRAECKMQAGNWAESEVDLLIKVVDAIIFARGAFLQDLVAKRNAAGTTQAKSYLHDQNHPGSSSMKSGTRCRGRDWRTGETRAWTGWSWRGQLGLQG